MTKMEEKKNLNSWSVIFDVDGTMVDNAAFHEKAWIELGRQRNFEITEEVYRKHIHSKSNDKIVRFLAPDADETLVLEIAEQKERIYRDSFRPHIVEIPGLLKLLEALYSEGVPMAAASNSPKGNVELVIDELGIREFFAIVIDRDQVETGKPNPDLFLRAAKCIGLPPEKCLVIEDSISGFQAAENAGMPYIAISFGADPDCLKTAGNALAVFSDFKEITPAVLRNLVH